MSLGQAVYRRVKTGKTFYRPMNRVVHAHVRSILPNGSTPDEPVFLGGGARPNARFQELCKLAGIRPKANADTGRDEPWELKDLRKTCATFYDEHMPESSIEILGHSVGGITYRHYAHRAPLAFKAIMTLPQPMAFTSLARGFDGECPCCRSSAVLIYRAMKPKPKAEGIAPVQCAVSDTAPAKALRAVVECICGRRRHACALA